MSALPPDGRNTSTENQSDIVERLRANRSQFNADDREALEAADEIESLRAELSRRHIPPAHPQQWQSIETSLKDGSHVLVWDNGADINVVSAYWLSYQQDDTDFSQWVYSDELLADAAPDGPDATHWMPLPPPPEAGE